MNAHRIFIPLFLLTFSLLSCSNKMEINHENYKIVGKAGSRGLQSVNGELVLDTLYKFISFRKIEGSEKYYIKFETHEGKKGIFYENFEQPFFELSKEYEYFKAIKGLDYFVFATMKHDGKGNKLEGVMDKEKNIILSNDYRQILYGGGKYFYASNVSDRKFDFFDLEGNFINNRGRYYYIGHTKHGIIYAQKDPVGSAGSIWGEEKYLLDENGKEIFEHPFQSITSHACHIDETKIFLLLKKNGANKLYYPNGELISEESTETISPIGLYYTKNQIDKFKSEIIEKYGNKNVIAQYKKDGKSFYLTYEGEIFEKIN